ncbi:MAG: LptA/OstA family protein [Verrucomicrobiales bacterium]|nr:LptA/OstA family protein [Verrucomicrobiales bacterium]
MKTTYLLATLLGLLGFGATQAQEGNSAFREILENKEAQDVLRTLKNDPENAVRAVQKNPDDLVKNMLGIYAETKNDSDSDSAPPATRSTKSQSEKALNNINNILAKPVSGPQALPVPIGDIKNLKMDSEQFNKLKSVVAEKVPQLSKVIPEEAPIIPKNPPAKPQITEVPSLPELEDPVATAPPTQPANRGTPLNFTSRRAPATPVRNMAPTTPQIPDSPELFAAAPTPQPLERRYPKPKKFQPTVAAKDSNDSRPKPKTDTMVITSSESEMDNKNHLLTFTGDVLVEMDGMELKCDTLKVHLNDANEMERIVATGGMVEIKKIGEGGKLQVAKAKKAEHVAATNTTTLSGGPPYLQNGDQYVNTDSEDSKIILGGDGKYRVHSPKAIGRTVIVVPIGNSKKFTQDLGIDQKLKNIGR